MKYADIDKIREAGLINDEQRQKIVEHFHLKPDDGAGKLLTIISLIGVAMAVGGVILLISANWEAIPREVKLATSVLLLLGCYGGGYYLREMREGHAKTGEALYLAGALMFLANIGLVGQIYHLSSRPPNAILLWWAGIAALPWLLRSKPLHLLALVVFTVWFIWEGNLDDSLLYLGQLHQFETCVFALLGLVILGFGYCLRRTPYFSFAPLTEHFGLLGFCAFSYPLAWKFFYDSHWQRAAGQGVPVILIGLALLAVGLLTAGLWREERLPRPWRWAWGGSLAVATLSLTLLPWLEGPLASGDKTLAHFFISALLCGLSLLQIQVGLRLQAPPMVNLGIGLIALVLLALYISLIDTMERTGWLFLISGMILVGFGVFLEKKRRLLLQRMRELKSAAAPANP